MSLGEETLLPVSSFVTLGDSLVFTSQCSPWIMSLVIYGTLTTVKSQNLRTLTDVKINYLLESDPCISMSNKVFWFGHIGYNNEFPLLRKFSYFKS